MLTGPNGAGKTTLLRLLSTYAQPSAGTVHWADADGTELRDPARVRARLGFAGHTPLVWDELTVRENLTLQLRLRDKGLDDAGSWLERLGLGLRADERADTLSRGMRQRLGLACAVAHRPQFLLLDEPASNLDEASIEKLLSILHDLRTAATIVVATHEPDRFRPLAARTLHLADGRITEHAGAA